MPTTTVTTRVHELIDFEVLADGLGFPDGRVIDADGSVLVVDIDRGRMLRVHDGTTVVVDQDTQSARC